MCLIAREKGATRNWRVRGVGRPWIWITRESWATRKMRVEQEEESRERRPCRSGAAQDAKGSGQGQRWGSRACQDGGVEEMALPKWRCRRRSLNVAICSTKLIPGRTRFLGGTHSRADDFLGGGTLWRLNCTCLTCQCTLRVHVYIFVRMYSLAPLAADTSEQSRAQ